ncbi:MAG: retron St85 family RNA-directed DNA polymerase [Candidatus Auribacterota bacterium]
MIMKASIANDLLIPMEMIEDALENAYIYIKQFNMPKRNGGYRRISQPSGKLKTIQYWLIKNLFQKIPVHVAAKAYLPRISILDNAKEHKNNNYFLKLDLKDFFQSIKFDVLLDVLKRNRKDIKWVLDRATLELIKKACFDKNNSLPIGYPTSPIISNIVMFDFDSAVVELIKDEFFTEKIIYTRYADDLVFSTNQKGAYKQLLAKIETLITNTSKPNIQINKSKIHISSRSGGSAIVTGLRIANDGHITIHRKEKDHVRLLLSLLKKRKLIEEEYGSLLGHISYIQHVDLKFYKKLNLKYFREINDLKQLINRDSFY